jgi:hypothetical protein
MQQRCKHLLQRAESTDVFVRGPRDIRLELRESRQTTSSAIDREREMGAHGGSSQRSPERLCEGRKP